MKVYIANFGQGNYAWPECLRRSTVATMNELAVQGFWEANDRESYIEYHLQHSQTAAGIAATRPVASRWFNLMTIIADTSGDIWLHREKETLWWTLSAADPPLFEQLPETAGHRAVAICHKPCESWSNSNRKGNRLDWNSLHPKAQEFLFTEGTLQQLRPDNSDYALALINGDDLTQWHSRPDWQAKVARRKKNPGKVFNPREIAVWRMIDTLKKTVAGANGQQISQTVKNKELRIAEDELIPFLLALLSDQDGLCAITGLRLQYDSDFDDPEMLCSLDRIDSNGHYEKNNLQIVCRFINRWKSSGDDAEFRRLVGIVRG